MTDPLWKIVREHKMQSHEDDKGLQVKIMKYLPLLEAEVRGLRNVVLSDDYRLPPLVRQNMLSLLQNLSLGEIMADNDRLQKAVSEYQGRIEELVNVNRSMEPGISAYESLSYIFKNNGIELEGSDLQTFLVQNMTYLREQYILRHTENLDSRFRPDVAAQALKEWVSEGKVVLPESFRKIAETYIDNCYWSVDDARITSGRYHFLKMLDSDMPMLEEKLGKGIKDVMKGLITRMLTGNYGYHEYCQIGTQFWHYFDGKVLPTGRGEIELSELVQWPFESSHPHAEEFVDSIALGLASGKTEYIDSAVVSFLADIIRGGGSMDIASRKLEENVQKAKEITGIAYELHISPRDIIKKAVAKAQGAYNMEEQLHQIHAYAAGVIGETFATEEYASILTKHPKSIIPEALATIFDYVTDSQLRKIKPETVVGYAKKNFGSLSPDRQVMLTVYTLGLGEKYAKTADVMLSRLGTDSEGVIIQHIEDLVFDARNLSGLNDQYNSPESFASLMQQYERALPEATRQQLESRYQDCQKFIS